METERNAHECECEHAVGPNDPIHRPVVPLNQDECIVLAGMDSRRAAAWYHSPAAQALDASYGLGNIGLRPGEVTVVEVLEELSRCKIGAQLGSGLEEQVRSVIRRMRESQVIELSSDPSRSRSNLRRRQLGMYVELTM